MPRADYRCPICGHVEEDSCFSAAVGAHASAPECPACLQGAAVPNNRHHARMEWIPAAGFDLKTDGQGGRGFQKFTVHRQVPTASGPVQVEETVDSLHRLRQIERDSEQRYRDGEGEPLRFRAYAQSGSNLDQNSFGASGQIGSRSYDSGQAPQKTAKISTRRHGERKPRIPVARGGGVTALKGYPDHGL